MAIVPVLSKILKLVIGKQLMPFLETNSLVCKEQFGFPINNTCNGMSKHRSQTASHHLRASAGALKYYVQVPNIV